MHEVMKKMDGRSGFELAFFMYGRKEEFINFTYVIRQSNVANEAPPPRHLITVVF